MTTEEFKAEATGIRETAMKYAMRYVRNTTVAEDIVQDIMLKLWSMHHELKPPAGPLTSILIRNACIDYLRRHKHFCDIEGICVKEPEKRDDDIEQTVRMMDIINNLPTAQQTILKLRHMQGMEMKEIAEITGTSEVNIRKILSRARQSVRDRFMKGTIK